MKHSFYYVILISVVALGCSQSNTNSDSQKPDSQSVAPPLNSAVKFNMDQKTVAELNWMNEPQSYASENNSLKVSVSKGTDFFNNPEDSSIVGSAPYLYKEVEGDFVAKALVQPDFSSQWNAVSLMLHIDSLNWIKFAFENSDATGPSIVSVVTKGNSDDANGVILNDDQMIWLAIVRKDNLYSMHWSVDGEDFKMTRLTSMVNQNTVKIGIEAQSPVGDNATHQIHYFEIEKKTIENLRNMNES